jgi:hypothetical protein
MGALFSGQAGPADSGPQDVTRPTELGGDVGPGKAAEQCRKYSASGTLAQSSRLIGVQDWEELLRRSTPRDLLIRVQLHRKYLPAVSLPANLQRALGVAWGQQ